MTNPSGDRDTICFEGFRGGGGCLEKMASGARPFF